MSGWRPIETAPKDVSVLLGRWTRVGPKLEWREDVEMPFESKFFGILKRKTFSGKLYQYWKPLPSPPTEKETTA